MKHASLFLIVLLVTASTCFGQNTQISNDFESGVIAPYAVEVSSGNTIAVETPPFTARSGTKAAKIVWNQAVYDGTRATRGTEGRSSTVDTLRIKKEGWYAFSFFIPNAFPVNKNSIIAQMHAYTATYNPAKTMTVGVRNDSVLTATYYFGISSVGDPSPVEMEKTGFNLASLVPRNRWIDVIMHVRFSKNKDGVFQLWYNGAPKNKPTIDTAGINLGSDGWAENDDRMINGTYQKFGIYAWDPSNYTPNETRTIWFDNVAYIIDNPIDAFERLQIPALAAASAVGKQPATFALSQNYPNPFNPATAIDYQLSVGSEVKLKVFDVLGREVATLVSATQSAGNYSVNFDAKNLTSGVYFYRLQAGNMTETKKLLLLK